MAAIYIGTSGWQYAHWRGNFYPEDLPTSRWLTYYSDCFNTVEVNSSFYHQVRAATFKKWQKQTPKYFVFSLKGHRFITHIKRLKDKSSVDIFLKNVQVLRKRDKPHVILWQFPPNFVKDTNRLKTFVQVLPNQFRHAFEFRHKSWVSKDTKLILEKAGVQTTIVIQDWKAWPQERDYLQTLGKSWVTDFSFVYIRFHGKTVLYASNYPDSELETWAEKIKEWRQEGLDVYAYFNNDACGFAAKNAKRLQEFARRA